MSEKAKVALKAGMVMTAVHESMCGVTLERNQTYLLTGTCEMKHTSYEYIIGQFNSFLYNSYDKTNVFKLYDS